MTTHSLDIRRDVPACLVIALITLAAYWQVFGHDFVNFDDGLYVTKNHHTQAGVTWKGTCWAFSTGHAANWHPLTWLSHMADCEFYGLNPSGHHLTSLLFHIANSLLLFWFLRRVTGAFGRCLFVAALFAVHPLHVESVAWIAERKDVLSTFFGLLALLAYARYADAPGLRRYLLVAILLALGLMAKPMLVTLPVVMLLLDYWPLDRIKHETPRLKILIEKLPLLLIAVASVAITVLAQQYGGAVGSLERFPLPARIANACTSCVVYIGKMFWPTRLAVFYPYPQGGPPLVHTLAACVVLVVITAVVLVWRKRRPYLAVGWLWFVCTLVPVIGIVQIGEQAYADRYTYIPYIGLFIMVAWGARELAPEGRCKTPALAASAIVVVIAFAATTWFQVGYWRNSETLWRRAVHATSNNETAHIKLGNAFNEQGRTEDAIAQYNKALRVKPNSARAYNNLGMVGLGQGKNEQAVGFLAEALRISPDYADAHVNMGIALASLDRLEEALAHFSTALEIDPDNAEAHHNLAVAHILRGQFDLAAQHFARAVQANPLDVQARHGLAVALVNLKKYEEAEAHLREVLRRQPDHAEAKQYLQQTQRETENR